MITERILVAWPTTPGPEDASRDPLVLVARGEFAENHLPDLGMDEVADHLAAVPGPPAAGGVWVWEGVAEIIDPDPGDGGDWGWDTEPDVSWMGEWRPLTTGEAMALVRNDWAALEAEGWGASKYDPAWRTQFPLEEPAEEPPHVSTRATGAEEDE